MESFLSSVPGRKGLFPSFFAALFLLVCVAAPSAMGTAAFDGGDGSEKHPYLISNAAGLSALNDYCGAAHRDKHFILTRDIALGEGWAPIGSHSAADDGQGAFQGTLDGRGHVVSNLSLQTESMAYAGLFASLYEADIRDVHLRGVSISQSVRAVSSAGGLAAVARKTNFLYCTVEGNVSSLYEAGGFLGRDAGGCAFLRCGTDCSVSASYFAGGFLGRGHAGSSVTGSYSRGRVMVGGESGLEFDSFFHGYGGGMAAFLAETDGEPSATFRNCFSTCILEAGDEGKTFTLGGFAGLASRAEFTNCTALGNVVILHSAKGWAGGFCGDSIRCNYVNCAARGEEVKALASQDYACAAGFAGRNEAGSCVNCYSSFSVQAHAAAASGACTAMAGGFAGYNSKGGTFSHCYASGAVEASSGSYYAMSGGFCGYDMEGSYSGCVASVSVAGTGKSVYTGGILGYMAGSGLRDNVFDSASSISANGSAMATAHRSGNKNGASAAVAGSVWNELGFAFGEEDEAPWKAVPGAMPELYFEHSQEEVKIFRISPDALSPSRNGSGAVPVAVIAEGSWNAIASVPWLAVGNAAGRGDGGFTVEAASNASSSSRNGVVTVTTPEGLTRALSIVQAGDPYDQWKKDKFPAGTPEDQMGAGAAPAGDGVSNLMKYATGLDPLKPCGSVTRLVLRREGGLYYMTLTWPVNPEATDVTFQVESSGDLETWREEEGAGVSGTRGEYRDTAAVGETFPRRFLRLKVSRE